MDAEWIITVFLILAELCTKGGRQTHKLAHVCEAEVLTVAVVAARRTNLEPNEWNDEMNLKRFRKTIETVNSQMEKMGLQRLHARTNEGFEIKIHASLFALSLTNL